MTMTTKTVTIDCYFCGKPYPVLVDIKDGEIMGHDRLVCPHCHAEVYHDRYQATKALLTKLAND